MVLKRKTLAFVQLMRLDKPVGILLVMWPPLWALWLASHSAPSLRLIVVFILGAVVMRSAGCIVNDYFDRDLDGHVARTKRRPFVMQTVSIREALYLVLGLLLVALILVLQLNGLCFLLAILMLPLICLYPHLKRYTHLPQAFLGVVFNMGVLMAFAAVTGALPWVAWVLFVSVWCWTMAYDTMYAMADREDDVLVGIKSTAILFGHYDRWMVLLFQSLFLVGLLTVGRLIAGHGWYYFGCFVVLCGMGYQQFLIWQRDPKQCFNAFLSNGWLGALFFICIVLNYYG